MLRKAAAALALLLLPAAPCAGDALEFSQAVGLTLEHHPLLRAGDREIQARQREVAQAGRLPRPTLELEAENFAGSGDWSGLAGSEWTLLYGQEIPRGGLLEARRAVAEGERARSEDDLQALRLEILSSMHLAFLEVLAAQEEVDVREREVAVAERLAGDVARRVAAGATLRAEESRARVSAASFRLELRRAQARLEQARSGLARSMGLSELSYPRVVGEIFLGAAPPPLEELLPLLDETPALRRGRRTVLLFESRARLQEAEGAGAWELGGGARYDAGGDQWGVVARLALPLPFHDRRRDAAAAARLRAEKSRARLEDLRLALLDEVRRAHVQLRTTHETLRLLREEIVPAAQEAFDAVQEAYAKGRASLTDVLDAETTLSQLSRRRIAVAHEHHAADARLSALVGETPHGISLSPEER